MPIAERRTARLERLVVQHQLYSTPASSSLPWAFSSIPRLLIEMRVRG